MDSVKLGLVSYEIYVGVDFWHTTITFVGIIIYFIRDIIRLIYDKIDVLIIKVESKTTFS